jgi:hypothetical protein
MIQNERSSAPGSLSQFKGEMQSSTHLMRLQILYIISKLLDILVLPQGVGG